jgi:hypothetical protein
MQQLSLPNDRFPDQEDLHPTVKTAMSQRFRINLQLAMNKPVAVDRFSSQPTR